MASTEPLPAVTLTITEVADTTGLSPDTLRYYEKARASCRALDDKIGHYRQVLEDA
jgi:hypothetical protein